MTEEGPSTEGPFLVTSLPWQSLHIVPHKKLGYWCTEVAAGRINRTP